MGVQRQLAFDDHQNMKSCVGTVVAKAGSVVNDDRIR